MLWGRRYYVIENIQVQTFFCLLSHFRLFAVLGCLVFIFVLFITQPRMVHIQGEFTFPLHTNSEQNLQLSQLHIIYMYMYIYVLFEANNFHRLTILNVSYKQYSQILYCCLHHVHTYFKNFLSLLFIRKL